MSRPTEAAANADLAAASQRLGDHARQQRADLAAVQQRQADYDRGIADGRLVSWYERFGWALLGSGVGFVLGMVVWWVIT